MGFLHSKWGVVAISVVLLYLAWHVSGYGVFIGKTGYLGINCNYLTSRGPNAQQQVIAVTLKYNVPRVNGCPIVYSFDTWDH